MALTSASALVSSRPPVISKGTAARIKGANGLEDDGEC